MRDKEAGASRAQSGPSLEPTWHRAVAVVSPSWFHTLAPSSQPLTDTWSLVKPGRCDALSTSP